MSHEIRTPMNGVFGMIDLALETNLTSEQRHFLQRARSSADLLLRVVDDILDFSKIEAGRLEVEPASFRLRETLAESVQAFGPRADAKKLELALQIPPGVPEHLVGDAFRLAQVLTNLVGNAIKFTEQGEVVVRVETEAMSADHVTLHFAICDSGPGIAPDKQRLIFQAFSQVDSSMARRFGGTGLGLSISARLVELMNGRMWLESEPRKGSTFHFTATFGCQSDAEQMEHAQRSNLEGLPVLIVDDNETSRSILADMVASWRMTPTVADGAKTALEIMHAAAARRETFPVVLVDADMPDIDGFELAGAISENAQLAGATVLMLPAADHAADSERGRELGIAAYVRKPVRQSQLLDAILRGVNRLVEPPPDDASDEAATKVRKGLRVLLAEDNEVNQEFALTLLRRHGHDVTVAPDGRQALRAWEKQRFDVILMDVQMPEMDGFEATAAIRAREAGTGTHIPIIAVTAHAMIGDRERCLAAGMDAYISKPIRAGALIDAMAQLVPERRRIARASLAEDADAAPHRTFDPVIALEYVEGDRDMLKSMIEIYSRQAPTVLAQIRDAIGRADGPALTLAAHRIKGSMSMFGATAACDAAIRIERLAEAGDFRNARNVFPTLESEVASPTAALNAFTADAA